MFANKSDCWANCTLKVNAVPCVEISEGWICLCVYPGNWETYCKTDYYNDYMGISIAYVVLGFLLTIPGIMLFSLDLILQFKHEPIINFTFITKFFAIIFGVCRFGHYCEIANTIVDGKYNLSGTLYLVSSVFYWIPDVLGIVIYFMITVMWLNLLLSLKNMSLQETNFYTIARNVYLVSSVIFIIGGVTFSVLLTLDKKILYFLFAAWIGIPLFITVFFCIYNICKLSIILETVEENLRRRMNKKNINLVLISIFLLFAFLELVTFQMYYFVTYDPVSYQLFSFILRLLELIVFYLFLIFLQKHLLLFFGFQRTPTTKSTSQNQTKSKGGKTTDTEGATT
eukprot:TRINITY_DN15837_c0_g1_i1.p1 TRINITY_DN15837_c0_g1~~TRINITY_DN15837_c0_g1_i1.p1  ORF type:complete len:341 (+),score=55.67 TRINITY_DN15837_c0_g1_i1:62-1084(+)